MQLTERYPHSQWSYWRVVGVLAAKDIVEALKNKTTLTMILGLAMMMLTVQALPLLLRLDGRPRIALHDAARSGVANTLRREGNLQVAEVRHESDAVTAARETSGPLLALSLPEGWDEENGPLAIDGYLVHWVPAETAAALVAQAEHALSAVTSRPVTVQLHVVYPTPESGGHGLMVSLGLVLAIILITAILVPYLFLDEKRAHTLEVLYVSPASPVQVVLGKALAGLLYGILAAGVLLAFNLNLVVSWGLMAATVVAGALFGVALGLLIGLIIENEGSVQLWVGAMAVILMFPLMLTFGGGGNIPAWLRTLLAWLPSSAMFTLFHQSLALAAQPGAVALNLTILLGSALLIYALAAWRLRRWERL